MSASLTGPMPKSVQPVLTFSQESSKESEILKATKEEYSHFIGTKGLKQQQQDHLNRLQTFATKREWEHLQQHTTHLDSGFDWWMFPINEGSAGYTNYYNVSPEDVTSLRRDTVFMNHYREGVILVTKSWGWDLEKGKALTSDDKQRWTRYEVRLKKMLQSLELFDEKVLHDQLINFIESQKITLGPWLTPWIKRLGSSEELGAGK